MENLEEVAVWHFGDIEFDEERLELRVRGILTDLEARPMEMLLLLIRRQGKVISDAEFIKEVWPDRHGHLAPKTVSNNVSKIRLSIGDNDHSIIETCNKKGYRLAVPAECAPSKRLPRAFPELAVGAPIPGRTAWLLVERLGGGKQSEVWLAEHIQTRERRVFKFCIHPRQQLALEREVTLFRFLEKSLGPRQDFAQVLDCNFEQQPFHVESAYSGVNLRLWATYRGGANTIPFEDRLEIVAKIADAVAAAHSVAVLHKDLKPDNVLVEDKPGMPPHVRLCDFGAGDMQNLNRLREVLSTQRGFKEHLPQPLSGTLLYMAPELLHEGVPSIKSDIYAIGVILYQLVVGQLTKQPTVGWEADIQDELLRETIAAAINGNPARRLPSAQLLAEQIRTLPERRAERAERRRNRHEAARAQVAIQRARVRRRVWGTISLVSLAAFILCAFFYARDFRQYQAAKAMSRYLEDDVLGRENPLYFAGASPLNFDDPALQSESGGILELAVQQRTLDYDVHLFGPNDKRTLETELAVVKSLLAVGRFEEGNALLDRTMPLVSALGLAPDEPLSLSGQFALALRARVRNQFDDARQRFQQLLAVCDQYSTVDPQFRARVAFHLAQVLLDSGLYQQAERHDRDLIKWTLQQFGAGEATMAGHIQLGAAMLKQGRNTEAEQELAPAERWLSVNVSPDDFLATVARQYLADTKGAEGQWDDAVALRKAALDSVRTVAGPNSEDALRATVLLSRAQMYAGHNDAALAVAQAATSSAAADVPMRSHAAIAARLTQAQLILKMRLSRTVENEAAIASATGVEDADVASDLPLLSLLWLVRAERELQIGSPSDVRRFATRSLEILGRSTDAHGADQGEIKAFIDALPHV